MKVTCMVLAKTSANLYENFMNSDKKPMKHPPPLGECEQWYIAIVLMIKLCPKGALHTEMGCSAVTELWCVCRKWKDNREKRRQWMKCVSAQCREGISQREREAPYGHPISVGMVLWIICTYYALHLVYSLMTPCWARESHVGKWMKVTWEWLEGSSAQGTREGLDRQRALGINALKAPSRECTSFLLFLLSHSSTAQHRGSKELWAVEKLR